MRALFLAALLMVSSPAQAFSPCFELSKFVRLLNERYGEKPVFSGPYQKNFVGVLTLSPHGSWTFFLMDRQRACILAMGIAGKLTPEPKD